MDDTRGFVIYGHANMNKHKTNKSKHTFLILSLVFLTFFIGTVFLNRYIRLNLDQDYAYRENCTKIYEKKYSEDKKLVTPDLCWFPVETEIKDIAAMIIFYVLIPLVVASGSVIVLNRLLKKAKL